MLWSGRLWALVFHLGQCSGRGSQPSFTTGASCLFVSTGRHDRVVDRLRLRVALVIDKPEALEINGLCRTLGGRGQT